MRDRLPMSVLKQFLSWQTLINLLLAVAVGVLANLLTPRLVTLVSSFVPAWRAWRIRVLRERLSWTDQAQFQNAVRNTLLSGFLMLLSFISAGTNVSLSALAVATADLELVFAHSVSGPVAQKDLDSAAESLKLTNQFFLLGGFFAGFLYIDSQKLLPHVRKRKRIATEATLQKLDAKRASGTANVAGNSNSPDI